MLGKLSRNQQFPFSQRACLFGRDGAELHVNPFRTSDLMNIVYIEAAAKVIPNKQQLINMVSKRVRQLSAGSRPMVEVDLKMGLGDVALAEIGEGKLTAEFFPTAGEEIQAA